MKKAMLVQDGYDHRLCLSRKGLNGRAKRLAIFCSRYSVWHAGILPRESNYEEYGKLK